MKKYILALGLIIGILFFFSKTNWQFRDRLLQYQYDFMQNNRAVTQKAEIDAILKDFEKVTFKDLEEEFAVVTLSDQKKYKRMIQGLLYYKIPREKLNTYIAGKFRLKEFIGKDQLYKECILNNQSFVLCILDPRIFYKTIELQEELLKQNYNTSGFYITNGHRHPSYNEKIGGASLSRHIKGQAVDITVTDINNDGKITLKDKDIVIDILENTVIKNQGGIGLYPKTMHLHYDVRGKRARWNSY